MKNTNSKTENKYVIASMSVAALLLAISLFSVLIIPVFSNNDTFQANVTVGNSAPVVSSVNLNDSSGGTIQLVVANDTNLVVCNATITDQNGYLDVVSANATIYYNNTNNSLSPNDNNSVYRNTSCYLWGGTGTTVYANCSVYFEHEAVNGTWTCNVSAFDASSNGTAIGNNTVDQLVGLTIYNDTINFGSLTNGQKSANTAGAPSPGVNITNDGNVRINVDVMALTPNMSCTGSAGCLGNIGVGNITFNLSANTYDNMASGYNLTNANVSVTNFNLVPQGWAAIDPQNSTRNLFFAIQIPSAVKGEFNTNITVSAMID